MIYRYADGSYELSSPDGEFSRTVSSEEGQEIIRRSSMPDEATRQKCLDAIGPRWIIT